MNFECPKNFVTYARLICHPPNFSRHPSWPICQYFVTFILLDTPPFSLEYKRLALSKFQRFYKNMLHILISIELNDVEVVIFKSFVAAIYYSGY